jgi:hypothetical protein
MRIAFSVSYRPNASMNTYVCPSTLCTDRMTRKIGRNYCIEGLSSQDYCNSNEYPHPHDS